MKQTAVEWLRDLYENQPAYDESILDEQWQKAIEMEKEQACDFADYVINRAKEFEDGLIDHREYEGSIDDMFKWRYADKATRAKIIRERNKFWKEADDMRREREKKFEQEANAKPETFNTEEK